MHLANGVPDCRALTREMAALLPASLARQQRRCAAKGHGACDGPESQAQKLRKLRQQSSLQQNGRVGPCLMAGFQGK